MGKVRALLLTLTGALLLAAGALAAPAAAHTGLEGSDPADGAALSAAPQRITLTFNEPVRAAYTRLSLTVDRGEPLAVGKPAVSGGTVTLAPPKEAPAGRWTVGYRVVSEDGHPVSGTVSFTVREAPSTPSPQASPTTSGPAPDAQASPETSEPALGGSGPGGGRADLAAHEDSGPAARTLLVAGAGTAAGLGGLAVAAALRLRARRRA
ncbi:copper resistance CopC family protein [Streptomyces sp. NPDC051940]|uniref:copper resistance CopC family protein n=1 Tax=Streptomyces sp. NPDC051940 TaxID=3155675 RepID=UPI003419C3A5